MRRDLLILGLLAMGCAHRPADRVLRGTLLDGEGLHDDVAVVVDGGTIREVVPGPRVRRRVGPRTPITEVDLITPGLVDAHTHPDWLAQMAHQVILRDCATYAEALERIAAFAATLPEDAPVPGHGWGARTWPDLPEGGWPLATDLARATGGRTAALTRVDGHGVWVTPDRLEGLEELEPSDGRIVVDDQGRPSGVVVDGPMHRLLIGPPPVAVRTARLAPILARLRDEGLTGIHTMHTDDGTLAALTALAAQDALPLTVDVWVAVGSDAQGRLERGGPWRVGRLAVRGVKSFQDGALGSSGAWLSEPYADDPHRVGTSLLDPAGLAERTDRLLAAGASSAVHAIGDAAVEQVVDGFVTALARHPEAQATLRVEHAQVVHPDTAARLAALDDPRLVLSMQPGHGVADATFAADRLGPARLDWAYAWRSLWEAAGPLALGSDTPVDPSDPRRGLYAATRGARAPDGTVLGQPLTLPQAVEGYSAAAARAAGHPPERGRVQAGAPAVLSLWALSTGPRALHDLDAARPLSTPSPEDPRTWVPVGVVVDGEYTPIPASDEDAP